MAERIALFVTCLVDQLFPKVGMSMASVLEGLGYQVDFPENQTCCGQPAFNSGYRDEARAVARHFIRTFAGYERIVVPSGSCTSMIVHHFAELFRKEPETLERVHALEKRVWEFSTFLTEVAGVEDVGAHLDEVVTFHDGCHALRDLAIHDAPRKLLSRVRGLELREMPPNDACCGSGGTVSVKFAELSGARARSRAPARRCGPCTWRRYWQAAETERGRRQSLCPSNSTKKPTKRWPMPT